VYSSWRTTGWSSIHDHGYQPRKPRQGPDLLRWLTATVLVSQVSHKPPGEIKTNTPPDSPVMYTGLLRPLVSHPDFIHVVPTSSLSYPMSTRPNVRLTPLGVNHHSGASRGGIHLDLLLLSFPRHFRALPYPANRRHYVSRFLEPFFWISRPSRMPLTISAVTISSRKAISGMLVLSYALVNT
jgi:hypothetical protein